MKHKDRTCKTCAALLIVEHPARTPRHYCSRKHPGHLPTEPNQFCIHHETVEEYDTRRVAEHLTNQKKIRGRQLT